MTSPAFFVEEHKILASLAEEGLDCLHISKRQADPALMERLLSLLPEECRRRAVIHGPRRLADEYELRGIHLDDPMAAPPEGYRGRISRTCADLASLAAVRRQSEYVFLRQPEATGQGADKPALFDEARRSGMTGRHVYAYGHLGLDDVARIRDLGFGGIVVRGDLWRRFDIHSQRDYTALLAWFERLRKAVG